MSESDKDNKTLGERIKEKGHEVADKTREFFGIEKQPETLPGKIHQEGFSEGVKEWGRERKEDLKEYKDKVNREIKD